MYSFTANTKADALIYFASQETVSRVPRSCAFLVTDWASDRSMILRRVSETLDTAQALVVRSSRASEDQADASQAGAYLSILDVIADKLADSIDEVIRSYGPTESGDKVLVQEQVRNVTCSGVLFTHDPETGLEYQRVNYVEGSDTTAVTSGRRSKTWIGVRDLAKFPSTIASLAGLLTEIRAIFGDHPFDVEWAIASEAGRDVVWLLQVRPLIVRWRQAAAAGGLNLPEILTRISHKVDRLMKPSPFLLGKTTVFGVMPDWNPAEIIGTRPRPLALSLYREMVTDAIWAYQRSNYGYRNLRSFPLVTDFFGAPYVDARVSFNSFLPSDLGEVTASRLVDHYLRQLSTQPDLHDKIEFEIVLSSFTFDMESRLGALRESGLGEPELYELRNSLTHLTRAIIDPRSGHWQRDLARIDELRRLRPHALAMDDELAAVYWLLEHGKRYGTLPFAGLARAAFVAVQMLRSLVRVDAMSQDDLDDFMMSLRTVNQELISDFASQPRERFLNTYGHLRPGTYDITSPSYAEAPDQYFAEIDPRLSTESIRNPWLPSSEALRAVENRLAAATLDLSAMEFFRFCRLVIEWRERAKFEFSHNVSAALTRLRSVGEQLGFSADDLSYISLSTFRSLHLGVDEIGPTLAREAQIGRERYSVTAQIELPPLICSPDDVFGFTYPELRPTFVTRQQISGIATGDLIAGRLGGAIALIRNADPGFDWIFAAGVSGFVTAWGGSNSHMAIRAGELGIPAAIGVGELRFEDLLKSRRLFLDCGAGRIEVLA